MTLQNQVSVKFEPHSKCQSAEGEHQNVIQILKSKLRPMIG